MAIGRLNGAEVHGELEELLWIIIRARIGNGIVVHSGLVMVMRGV